VETNPPAGQYAGADSTSKESRGQACPAPMLSGHRSLSGYPSYPDITAIWTSQLSGHHNHGPGEFIVPALLPGIPQNPEEPEEEENHRQRITGQVPQDRAPHAEWPPIGANYPDAKYAHSDGLAIASRENHEIHQQEKQGEAGYYQKIFVRADYRPALERRDHECEAHHSDQRDEEIEYQGAVAKTEARLFERADERVSGGRIEMRSSSRNPGSDRADSSSAPNTLGRYSG
jgi:hypothetical protein